jgi:spore germination protein YaaH
VPPTGAVPGLRAVAIPSWNLEQGSADVAAHTGSLDEVSPEAHRIGPWGGLCSAARDAAGATAMETLRATGLVLIPSISNRVDGHRSPDVVCTMLQDPDRRARHVQAVRDLVASHGYHGVDLDYQGLHREDRAPFSRFVTQLADALHERDRRLSVTVHATATEHLDEPASPAHDYAALGLAADEVRLMTWGYHDPTTPAGPSAPVDWVADVLRHAAERVPAEKLLLGVTTSGYDWVSRGGVAVGHPEAVGLAEHHAGGRVEFDPLGEAPWFRYLDPAGTAHEVWFEDARSLAVKRRRAAEIGVRGIVLWLSATPDPDVWAGLATDG